jgi:hypothetical protein
MEKTTSEELGMQSLEFAKKISAENPFLQSDDDMEALKNALTCRDIFFGEKIAELQNKIVDQQNTIDELLKLNERGIK